MAIRKLPEVSPSKFRGSEIRMTWSTHRSAHVERKREREEKGRKFENGDRQKHVNLIHKLDQTFAEFQLFAN